MMHSIISYKKDTIFTSLGLMCGTSMDGIDASIIRTDGNEYIEFLASDYLELPQQLKTRLQESEHKPLSVDDWLILTRDFTNINIDICKKLIQDYKVDIIGFHGQTIKHLPALRMSYQLGDPKLLAHNLELPVIADFRQNDLLNGGQGAPIVPIFHKNLLLQEDIKSKLAGAQIVAILNIGGVSNITYIDQTSFNAADALISFDCGPGNAMLDQLMLKYFNKPYDYNGKQSAQGNLDKNLLNSWLDDEYFKLDYPKSLDKNYFKYSGIQQIKKEDQITTSAEFTIQSIVKAINSLPKQPNIIITCGGGRHNHYIISRLKEILKHIIIQQSDDFGWDGDILEAVAIAYLASRSLKNLPLTFKSTTGCAIESLNGGTLYLP